jgi:hypothetical protein
MSDIAVSNEADGRCCADKATASGPEDEWFHRIRPDFAQGNISIIAGAKKLIEAKQALRKRNGSFIRLVERLEMDLGKAERLMKIARHSVLSDSAHAPNLPLSWMTLYTLSQIPAKQLSKLIEEGAVHPYLERKEAERLVQQVRQSNSRGSKTTATGSEDVQAGSTCAETTTSAGDMNGPETINMEPRIGTEPTVTEEKAKALPAAETLAQVDDIGPNSQAEIQRKLARLEELERDNTRLTRHVTFLESENVELRGRLAPETDIPHQRKLFNRVVRRLREAEASNLEKDQRFLRNSATDDMIELVRSAKRDGLEAARFDLMYRPDLY